MPRDLVRDWNYLRTRAELGDAPEVCLAVRILEDFVAEHPFFVMAFPVWRKGKLILMRIVKNHPGSAIPLRVYYTVARKGVYLWEIGPYDRGELLELPITRGCG